MLVHCFVQAGVVERCGAFESVMSPGVHCLIPFVHSVAAIVSLRIKQLDVRCETKVTRVHARAIPGASLGIWHVTTTHAATLPKPMFITAPPRLLLWRRPRTTCS